MKFKCNQAKLSKALNIVSKAVSTRTTIPILKGILVDVKGDKLKLSASDLDINIEKTINIKDSEEGRFVVESKLFGDIIRKLPGDEISFTLRDNLLEIECLNSKFDILTLPADDFPEMNKHIDGNQMIFNKEVFRDIIKKTTFAASIDESKGIITGVLIELEDNNLRMVAIDGFRMAVVNEELSENYNEKVIISSKILNDIGKIINESSEDVDFIKMSLSENSASVIYGTTEISLRLMEGEFIKYRDVLPKNNPISVKLNRVALNEAIDRASLLSKEGKNNLIKLTCENEKMYISSKSEEGSVVEDIFIEKTGDDIEIGFNAKYLIDILKVIDDEEIEIKLNTPTSACLVTAIEEGKYEYLILPVRITKNI